MSLTGVRALTFDTGGTILDWHTGFRDAFAAAGIRHGIKRDWAKLANELRRRTMEAMLNLGEHAPPAYTFDDAHRFCLDTLLADEAWTCSMPPNGTYDGEIDGLGELSKVLGKHTA